MPYARSTIALIGALDGSGLNCMTTGVIEFGEPLIKDNKEVISPTREDLLYSLWQINPEDVVIAT